MERDQAETELTALLIGRGEHTLTATQRLVVLYASEKQRALLAQANAMREQATQVMADAVGAIRVDIGVPLDVPLKFEPEGDGIVVRWPLPTPPEAPPTERPAPTRPMLVKDSAPEAASAAEDAPTT